VKVIEDLNMKRSLEWKCDSFQNPLLAVRRELSGRGGATDSHGHHGVSGCYFQPTSKEDGREELNSPASVSPFPGARTKR
jgi:hypothetical protein